MHSLATAISGKIRKLNRLDAPSLMSAAEDFRDSGEGVELRSPAPPGELESLLETRPLEELERLLREHFLGSARGPMDNQEYLEFVAILEDTRTRTGSHGRRPVRAVAQSLTRQSSVTKPSA